MAGGARSRASPPVRSARAQEAVGEPPVLTDRHRRNLVAARAAGHRSAVAASPSTAACAGKGAPRGHQVRRGSRRQHSHVRPRRRPLAVRGLGGRRSGRAALGARGNARRANPEAGADARIPVTCRRRPGPPRAGAVDPARALLDRAHALLEGGLSRARGRVVVPHPRDRPHDPRVQLPPVHEPAPAPFLRRAGAARAPADRRVRGGRARGGARSGRARPGAARGDPRRSSRRSSSTRSQRPRIRSCGQRSPWHPTRP